MRDAVRITGGVWTPVEHLNAYQQIGRIVLKQTRFNRLIHVGTIILAGSATTGSDTGRNGTNGSGAGYPLVSKAEVRGPLDCLYGIRDPEKAKALLEQKIQRA
jgi:hypothetical protein